MAWGREAKRAQFTRKHLPFTCCGSGGEVAACGKLPQMRLTLAQEQAITQLANHLYDFLPGQPHARQHGYLYREVEIWRDRMVDSCPVIASAFEVIDSPVRLMAVGFNLDSEAANIPSPSVATTSRIVEDALAQAETLIGQHGAGSGLDRVHTAFHAYLESICRTVGPGIGDDAPITALFSYLRQHHPSLVIADPEEKEKLEKIFRSLSKIVDTLDHLRNTKSLAHPNPVPEDPEAMLLINVVRAMLWYLDMRLR
jgi:hypothetical protein